MSKLLASHVFKTVIFPGNVYRHYHDIELARLQVRDNNGDPWAVRNPTDIPGTPEVYPLLDYSVIITEQWQYYLIAMNGGMALQHISAALGKNKAFTNTTAFPGSANYILGEDLVAEPPRFGKVYTCGGSLLSGRIENDMLTVVTMNGNTDPLLKPGRVYPTRISEINIDNYLFNPREHPWMFVTALNVSDGGVPFPFAHGGYYSWTPEPTRMFTFIPLVSRRPVIYPASRVQKVRQWVSPYKVIVT
jgi:hypothetical protein